MSMAYPGKESVLKISVRASLAATLIVGLCVTSASEAADATGPIDDSSVDPTIERIVVFGAKTELAIDGASLRVDTKQHARSLERSVSAALERESGETRVAVGEGRTIG
jgi:hypothetical protein